MFQAKWVEIWRCDQPCIRSIRRFRAIVLALSGLGLASALAAWFIVSPVCETEARLMVRLAPQEPSAPAAADKSRAKAAARDRTVRLNSEIEILTSQDVIGQVVGELRPETLLAGAGRGANPLQAARVLRRGLRVEVPRHSNIIRVRFQHPDPALAPQVLRSLLDHYLERQAALGRAGGTNEEMVSRTREELRRRLEAAEAELRAFKAREGIALSLEDTRKSCLAQITQTRQLLLEAEAALAERKAAAPGLPPPKDIPTAAAELPPDKFNHYTNLCAQLNTLMLQHRELLRRFTEENAFVQRLQAQIAQLRTEKTNLEAEFPKLPGPRPPGSDTRSEPASAWLVGQPAEAAADLARAQALAAKVATFSNQLARLQGEAAKWEALEPGLAALERQRSLAEANCQQFLLACEQARLRAALEGQSVTLAQTPSPPVRLRSRVYKTMVLLAGGGVASGVGLALLLGLLVRPAAPRQSELASRSIPPPGPSEPDSFSASIQPLRKGESRKTSD